MNYKTTARRNTGIYTVTVTNEYGSDSADIDLVILGPPSRPEGPLVVSDVRKNHAKLTWQPPSDDGGKPITNYVVEKLRESDGVWEKVSDVIKPNTNEFLVPKLKEGEKYKFRLAAENDNGVSEPLETATSTTAKDPFKPPSKPGKPEVADSDKKQITIKWSKPEKDGGSPIEGYNVDRKDPRTGRWIRLNKTPVKDTEFTDDKVQPNKEFEYRVSAINEGGESEPSDISKAIKARPLKEAPKIDKDSLSGINGNQIKVKAGEPLSILVPMTGSPKPKAEWKKNDSVVQPSNRVQLDGNDDEVQLHVPSAQRSDSGKYNLKLSNEFGEDEANFDVIVLGKLKTFYFYYFKSIKL